MPKTTFVAVDPNQVAHTRTSQSRTYTHCIVVRLSEPYARRMAEEAGSGGIVASNFAHYQALIAGTSSFSAKGSWETDEYHQARVASDIDRAKQHLKGAETLAEYRARLRYDAIQAHVEAVAAGRFTQYSAVAWAGRPDLAEAQVRQYTGKARIAEVLAIPATIKPTKGA